jgi:hypothetical protein
MLAAHNTSNAPDTSADEWAYTIVPGDTLIGITERMLRPGTSWRVLQRLNRVANPRRLLPGHPLQVPLALLREEPLAAEVLYVRGAVEVERAGAPAAPLATGASLASADVVRTGAQSSALLRFGDGSRVLLQPQTSMRVERSVRYGASPVVDTELRLDRGGAETRVEPQPQPHFRIGTPVANLGVRGTEFRTRAAATATTVEVIAGHVEARTSATSAQRVVDAGFGAVATDAAVGAPQPLPPAPDLSGVPTLVERLPLRLSWHVADAQGRYRARVVDAEQPDRLVLDGLFGADGARWSDDLPDGRYLLRLRAIGADGVEGFEATAAFVLKARPEPPFTTRPRADERTADDPVRFAWTRNVAAARYQLQVSNTPDFATRLVDRDDLSETEVQLSLPPGTYHWRIRSIRADGDVGPWSDEQGFTRVELPPAPASQPARMTADGVLMSWRATGGVRYQLQVARDPSFATPLEDVRLEEPQWLLAKPEPGRYYMHVRSIDADGFAGPYGATQQVDVPRSRTWLWLLLPLAVGLVLA